jgi:amino-acid N-acetyltransferase
VHTIEVDIRRARRGDFAAVSSLLRDARLPVEDLSEERMADFFVASRGGFPAGAIGVEAFSQVGLLRSLVVDPESRAAGLGRMLVAALEAHARRRGLTELWLLTIDAERYFRALGYTAKQRSEAPAAIRETAEFSRLCPGSAVLMYRKL